MTTFNKNMTEWEIDGKRILINLQNITESRFYEAKSIILYLLDSKDQGPSRAVAYNLEGHKVFETPRPTGYCFEYLTEHPKAPVAIVCGVVEEENPEESWSDFFFSVCPETGELKKMCVAR